MGFRKVIIRESAAYGIAEISWCIESEGLVATAEKFSEDAYDLISKLGDGRKGYRSCRDPDRDLLGYNVCLIGKNTPLYLLSSTTKLLFRNSFLQN